MLGGGGMDDPLPTKSSRLLHLFLSDNQGPALLVMLPEELLDYPMLLNPTRVIPTIEVF